MRTDSDPRQHQRTLTYRQRNRIVSFALFCWFYSTGPSSQEQRTSYQAYYAVESGKKYVQHGFEHHAYLQSKYGSCRSMIHWNPVGCPVLVNSTVTLLLLPTVSPVFVPTTTQNLESARTRTLFRMAALSSLTGSTATTRSTWSPAGRSVRL